MKTAHGNGDKQRKVRRVWDLFLGGMERGQGEYFVRSKYNGFLVPILPHTTHIFCGLVLVSIFLVCHVLLSEHRSAGSVFVFLVANSHSILFASFGIVLSHSIIML